MYKVLVTIALLVGMTACNNNEDVGNFTVTGIIENAADQQIYLEQLHFSEQAPFVMDTAELVNGKFTINGTGSEEGMYRLRLQHETNGYIFINDSKEISLTANNNDKTLEAANFSGPSNSSLKSFLTELNTRRIRFVEIGNRIKELQLHASNDSALAAEQTNMDKLNQETNQYIISSIDGSKSPIVTIFALGYAQNIDTAITNKSVKQLVARFPNHSGITHTVARYQEMMAGAQNQPTPDNPNAGAQKTGDMAPDFSMNDTQGKPFKLSSMKGKYVLVDFWASWCGPCRGENPNIVAMYHKYKQKNFSILGVSLDERKDAWLNAIKADKLDWKHVSDLKGWANATVDLYGYRAIPYNVLLDPTGKIIATDLRGAGLEQKLAEILK